MLQLVVWGVGEGRNSVSVICLFYYSLKGYRAIHERPCAILQPTFWKLSELKCWKKKKPYFNAIAEFIIIFC